MTNTFKHTKRWNKMTREEQDAIVRRFETGGDIFFGPTRRKDNPVRYDWLDNLVPFDLDIIDYHGERRLLIIPSEGGGSSLQMSRDETEKLALATLPIIAPADLEVSWDCELRERKG